MNVVRLLLALTVIAVLLWRVDAQLERDSTEALVIDTCCTAVGLFITISAVIDIARRKR